MSHFLILIPQSLNSQFLNLDPIAIIMRIVSKKRTWFLDQITRSDIGSGHAEKTTVEMEVFLWGCPQ